MIQQNQLIDIELPTFINSFKIQIINISLPYLKSILNILQNAQITSQSKPSSLNLQNNDINHNLLKNTLNNNPQISQIVIALLVVIIFLQIIIAICSNLFSKSKERNMDLEAQQTDNSLSKEIMSLNKEIKSVRTSLIKVSQLTQERLTNVQAQMNSKNFLAKPPQSQIKITSGVNSDSVKQLIKAYEKSMQSSNKIAEFMLQNQEQIVRQLKKVKKNRVYSQTTPSHNSVKDSSQIKTKKRQKYSSRIRHHIEEQQQTNQHSNVSSNTNNIVHKKSSVQIKTQETKEVLKQVTKEVSQQASQNIQNNQKGKLPQKNQKNQKHQSLQDVNSFSSKNDQTENIVKTSIKKQLPKAQIPSNFGPRRSINKKVPPPFTKSNSSTQKISPVQQNQELNNNQNIVSSDEIVQDSVQKVVAQQIQNKVQQIISIQSKIQQNQYQTTQDTKPTQIKQSQEIQVTKRQMPPVRKIPAPPNKGTKKVPPPPGRK